MEGMQNSLEKFTFKESQNKRLVCPGCNGKIKPNTIKLMGFGNLAGYRHLYYCNHCKRFVCCPIQGGYSFGAARCPECNNKLTNTDKEAQIYWKK